MQTQQQLRQSTSQDMLNSQPIHTQTPRSDPTYSELLNCIRHRMTVSRSHIIEHTTLALKDEAGSFSWVEFSPKFHSHLFKLAFSLLGKLITPAAQKLYKKVIFVYILEILNQEGKEYFFTPKHNYAKTTCTNWEAPSPPKPTLTTNTGKCQSKENLTAKCGQQTEAHPQKKPPWPALLWLKMQRIINCHLQLHHQQSPNTQQNTPMSPQQNQ